MVAGDGIAVNHFVPFAEHQVVDQFQIGNSGAEDADDLERLSRENLARYQPDLKVKLVESETGGRAAIVSVLDGYDAARLLLDTLHSTLAPQMHGDFFVATPARDMFVAISCDPPEFVDKVQQRVLRDFKRLPYPITDALFIVTRDGVAGTREAA